MVYLLILKFDIDSEVKITGSNNFTSISLQQITEIQYSTMFKSTGHPGFCIVRWDIQHIEILENME